jgi:hypothetical protein
MSPAAETVEKLRVNGLTVAQREAEEEYLTAMVSNLEHRKGINSGEAYSMKGKFKTLSRDYGFPFMVYWTGVWLLTGVGCYTAMEYGGIEALPLIHHVDQLTGFDLASKIDPTVGNIAVAGVVNEMMEPIRLPFVVMSTPFVVDTLLGRVKKTIE